MSQVLVSWWGLQWKHLPIGRIATYLALKKKKKKPYQFADEKQGMNRRYMNHRLQALSPGWGLLVTRCISGPSSSFSLSVSSSISSSWTLALMAASSWNTTTKDINPEL